MKHISRHFRLNQLARKGCAVLLSLILLPAFYTAVCLPTASAGAALQTAVVNNPDSADRLNLRVNPSLDSRSLGKYFNGVTVTLLSGITNGWVKVRIGTIEGYMMEQYLTFNASPGSVTSAMPTVKVSYASGKKLNLREKPSLFSHSLGLYPGGTSVLVMGVMEKWVHVQVDGLIGFMMQDYLTPQISYTSGSSTYTNPATSTSSHWQGPAGTHAVAPWTIPILDNTAVVSNPNAKDRLHLRTGPGKDYPTLGKYYNGVTVATGITYNGYTAVTIGNLHGYMSTAYLTPSTSTPPASAMPIMIVVNPNPAHNLHLREKQSTSSQSLGLYPNGTQIVLMGFSNTWAHVIVNGQMGFMLGKYLQ